MKKTVRNSAQGNALFLLIIVSGCIQANLQKNIMWLFSKRQPWNGLKPVIGKLLKNCLCNIHVVFCKENSFQNQWPKEGNKKMDINKSYTFNGSQFQHNM